MFFSKKTFDFEANQDAYMLFCKIERQEKADLSNSRGKIQVLILEFITFIFVCVILMDILRSYNRILNM